MSVDKLRLADTPNLKSESAISGGWTPLSPPIKGVQLADGTILIYSGRARLAHAKATGTPYILVNVTRASGIKTDLTKWMRVNDAYDNLLNGTASAEQAALAWADAKNKGVSYADFEAAGYVMKDNSGETTPTMRLGITAAENATAEELSQLANGERNIIEILSDINKREAAAQQEVGSTFSLRETGEEITKGIPLYEGYTINELKHGEISDLASLKSFVEGAPIASVEKGLFSLSGKLTELAAKIGEYYKKTGKSTLNIEPVGTVLLDANGASNSIGHFMKNRRSTDEHKQMVTNAFELVPDVLEKGRLVEYGTQTDNPLLSSYLFVAPVAIEGKRCIMAVRVRRQVGQNGRFYLHGVELLETLKEKSRKESIVSVSGLATGNTTSADQRDVFRVVKKALLVNTENTNNFEDSASTASLTAENPDDMLGVVKRARRSTLAERMMHHAQAEANRIRRTVKGKSNTKEAAEVMASVLIALETARKYVPTARIPRMTAKRAALEAYIAMMQEGRYGINRNGGTKRRGLTEAEIAATIDRAQNRHRRAGV